MVESSHYRLTTKYTSLKHKNVNTLKKKLKSKPLTWKQTVKTTRWPSQKSRDSIPPWHISSCTFSKFCYQIKQRLL